VFLTAQILTKSWPGAKTVPSGMVMSPSKTLLLQASPSEVVACEVGNTATGVSPVMGVLAPGTGVFTNEKVGRAATSVVGEAAPVFKVGNGTVAREVTVAVAVLVGAACAVCVSSTESWATVVPTRAVLKAFTSVVGAGAAPTLQDVNIRAAVSMMIRISRVGFLENMIGTSKNKQKVLDWMPSPIEASTACLIIY